MTISARNSFSSLIKLGFFLTLLVSFSLGAVTAVRAETLADLILELTNKNNLIKAAEDDLAAARERARVV